MAKKNSQSLADRAVTDVSKKSSKSKTASKDVPAPAGKKTSVKNTTVKRPGLFDIISVNAFVALLSLGLLILFSVIAINPDGALLRIIQSVLLGLLGRAGFYFAIPGLVFLFIIHTFGRKSNVTLRSVCVILFVFLCGSIYHLAVQVMPLSEGIDVLGDLYLGGVEGKTGGVLCGGFAMLLRWSCGNAISYIICILGAIISLLAVFKITIPSIIRAIANRPRDDWDEEEQREYVEPAAVVVNHIANKQIEHKRQRRQKQYGMIDAQAKPVVIDELRSSDYHETAPAASSQVNEELLVSESARNGNRAGEMMAQIELDTSAPVGSAGGFVQDRQEFIPIPTVKDAVSEPELESIPEKMPQLELKTTPAQEKKDSAKQIRSAAVSQKNKKQTVSSEEGTNKQKVSAKDAEESAQQVAQEIEKSQNEKKTAYCFPPIELLKQPLRGGVDGTDEMRENSRRLNETLASFKIDAHIINVTRGPSVTRYEVELDKGVRLSKLTGCADDIALSLGASGVRIAAVPGKISIVGIEVPNRAVTTVTLREVIDSNAFNQSRSKSSFAVGKDIGGSCIVGNISKMPHMLIAGTTGSGKSVCMNSIIISLLYKAGPEDVKLIMVDPKMVELGIYNGIPHLLIPVVTDPKKAAGSLQWAVTEMLRRYKLMSDAGVRDLESYNSIITAEEGQKLPQIVIIIDELADLMLVAAKEVEDSICRVAQMGRAAGMHLIIATQRPSADVITGLMKANIPSRIAFSVASAMESRIILDTQGAEKLVGKGDMLYAPIGSGKPLRVQGCFVTDSEVESVASYVKENFVSDYNEQILKEIEQKAQQTGKAKSAGSDPDPSQEELEGDEMLPAAVDVILETGQASVSMLQRRLKLGYARAARIVDEMEEKGIVGPFQGSKPRAILVTKEQWQSMRGGEIQLGFDDYENQDSMHDEMDSF